LFALLDEIRLGIPAAGHSPFDFGSAPDSAHFAQLAGNLGEILSEHGVANCAHLADERVSPIEHVRRVRLRILTRTGIEAQLYKVDVEFRKRP
jgi:hypothetical protein